MFLYNQLAFIFFLNTIIDLSSANVNKSFLISFSTDGKINLFNKKYEKDMRPIEEGCGCPACQTYSRAYIRHLFVAEEMLAMRLSVMHNLYFYNKLMEKIRNALDEGTFEQFRCEHSEKLARRI